MVMSVAIVPIFIPNTPPILDDLTYTQRLAPPIILSPTRPRLACQLLAPVGTTFTLDPTRYVSVRQTIG